MQLWSTLLQYLGLRAQARAVGATAQEANKAATVGVLLQEAEKKAAEEQKQEQK